MCRDRSWSDKKAGNSDAGGKSKRHQSESKTWVRVAGYTERNNHKR